ncbi:hypothetical protein SFUMM280S_09988 [Streptomyces fumanus]
MTGYRIGAEHMLATADGHYVVDQPSNAMSVNVGDITGWGGDLMTFYTDWRELGGEVRVRKGVLRRETRQAGQPRRPSDSPTSSRTRTAT